MPPTADDDVEHPSSSSPKSSGDATPFDLQGGEKGRIVRSRRRVWSEKDISMLVALHVQFGNKWTMIARNLPGRNDNDCKNIFHSALRSKTAIGPTCDDPQQRRRAQEAALEQYAGSGGGTGAGAMDCGDGEDEEPAEEAEEDEENEMSDPTKNVTAWAPRPIAIHSRASCEWPRSLLEPPPGPHLPPPPRPAGRPSSCVAAMEVDAIPPHSSAGAYHPSPAMHGVMQVHAPRPQSDVGVPRRLLSSCSTIEGVRSLSTQELSEPWAAADRSVRPASSASVFSSPLAPGPAPPAAQLPLPHSFDGLSRRPASSCLPFTEDPLQAAQQQWAARRQQLWEQQRSQGAAWQAPVPAPAAAPGLGGGGAMPQQQRQLAPPSLRPSGGASLRGVMATWQAPLPQTLHSTLPQGGSSSFTAAHVPAPGGASGDCSNTGRILAGLAPFAPTPADAGTFAADLSTPRSYVSASATSGQYGSTMISALLAATEISQPAPLVRTISSVASGAFGAERQPSAGASLWGAGPPVPHAARGQVAGDSLDPCILEIWREMADAGPNSGWF
ncbi:hypothetical protein HYH03_013111 [Edaphochlamys debaryana]|uniref:Uncharacterized protein n=1 Tax=Edaphochlamys debaryana TaxID=47281 RepID=A0A836BTE7_9CHLO|nr:hypothetical protein HYH03_013111 [Edaphochlamys debaryana]|eukprot:KAG2488260.1 hypothetical protein HYH03_013111 [Edaphochlamys debaryana]